MKVTNLEIQGLKLITLKSWNDERGYFVERYNEAAFEKLGLPSHFFQDNFSYSLPGVVRGLHYQFDPPQGKLVGVTSGRIWDVAVDLRSNSPSFGKYFATELSAENGLLLWIPAGFAHGFSVLGPNPAQVLYKVDSPYNGAGETGICWNDPDLNIEWPIEQPILSRKDLELGSFSQYRKNPRF